MRTLLALVSVMFAVLLGGCGVAPTAATVRTPVPTADQVAQALEAYRAAVGAPGDGAALRQVLDQLELVLALNLTEAQRTELLAAEADLVTRIEQLALGSPTPTPTVSPSAESTPTPTAPTGTPVPAPARTSPVAAPTARPTRPTRPTYGLTTRKSFEGSGNSGQFASCIDVQIVGRSGPISGAVLGINNGDHTYQNQTDQNGYAGRCGLGASTWSVVLFWTPGGGQARGVATTVYINGATEQRAAVVFQER